MYLVDTNIYLEIFLAQENSIKCKRFLNKNAYNLHLTDFSLHSIGIILYRYNKKEIFKSFLNEIIPIVPIIALKDYDCMFGSSLKLDLDFDDSYQYCVAKENDLIIVTMDKDFCKVDDLEVLFL